uniref:Putative secreted protein n=1 Tax=Anopheles marajoara TaxID=58244 RepID=A0A2M4CBZ5_9DIPT
MHASGTFVRRFEAYAIFQPVLLTFTSTSGAAPCCRVLLAWAFSRAPAACALVAKWRCSRLQQTEANSLNQRASERVVLP